jgi:hypothetical protein
VGRKKTLPLGPTDPPPKPPWRTVISLNRVECVARGSGGGLIISGRTGGREICVEIPKSEINALLAGSRWPLGDPVKPDDAD